MPGENLTETEKLKRLFEQDWAAVLQEYPEFATLTGVRDYDGLWTEQTPEAIETRRARRRGVLRDAEAIHPAALEPGCRLDHELFLRRLRDEDELDPYPGELLALSQMDGVHQLIARVLERMPCQNLADYENVLKRLDRADRLVGQHVEFLKRGASQGVVPPAIAVRGVPAQLESLIGADLATHPLLVPLRKFPASISEPERAGLASAAEGIVENKLLPAFERLLEFVKQDYLPRCRETIAWSDLPTGAEWYAAKVRTATARGQTPEGLHQLGLSEVARIRAEMEEVVASSGFSGGFEKFVEFLKNDDRFFHTSAEELLAGYRDIAKRIDCELPRLFGKLPRLPYGVVAIPDYMAPSRPTAFYHRGSLEAGRAGLFYANTYNLRARPKWEMEPLTLHEAVPGHHLQISLAQELVGLPEFRKNAHDLAYIEGWGLYAESLGREIGLYANPYSRFGQLVYEMWRAVRLVVDTGMHAFGWKRDDAIGYMLDNTGKIEHDVVVEIDRYLVMPAQALAYKVGELAIRRLRERSSRALGSAFDLRAFHDVVLEQGALPLDVLERRVEAWVEVVRSGPVDARVTA